MGALIAIPYRVEVDALIIIPYRVEVGGALIAIPYRVEVGAFTVILYRVEVGGTSSNSLQGGVGGGHLLQFPTGWRWGGVHLL